MYTKQGFGCFIQRTSDMQCRSVSFDIFKFRTLVPDSLPHKDDEDDERCVAGANVINIRKSVFS